MGKVSLGEFASRISILILFHCWRSQKSPNCNRAVVVEQSKASYFIDVLGMLKVKGSNPGRSENKRHEVDA